MKRIAVINQKGGVGKTTTTVNLGAALAHHGRPTLLLDLDPQANMTVHVDKRPDMESDTLTNLLIDDKPLNDLIQATSLERLSVVPSDTSLAGVGRSSPTASVARRSSGRRSRAPRSRSASTSSCSTARRRSACSAPTRWSLRTTS